MSRTHDPYGLGFEIPEAERTPVVEALLRKFAELRDENQRLREEIDRLKNIPPRPTRQPSMLSDEQPPSARKDRRRQQKRLKGKKRPGSSKRQKTSQLRIDETLLVTPENLPPEAVRVSYRDFIVQDLVIKGHNVCYRREVFQLPDGSYVAGQLPPEIQGHFGPQLHGHVLYQYYHNHVTQPLLLEELRELGVDISAGQIDRLLHESHQTFSEEKDGLLPAAREVSQHFHTDDTSARHRGQNGHTTVISNEFFASFVTSDSKNRINFLEILRAPHNDYIVGEDALLYMECQGLAAKMVDRLRQSVGGEGLTVVGKDAWERQLNSWRITSAEQRQLITEGALFGCLMYHDLYIHQPFLSDDAGQFKILGYMHALCWLHAERNVARVVPMNAREHRVLEETRGEIWKYYQRLKAYRLDPTPQRRGRLERDFDRLFLQQTGFVELNEALARIHGKRDELLLVLDYPHLPLDNNLAERDLREWAKTRKISFGTRSDRGRTCRDVFLSLKNTCRKLGVSFLRYLQDRLFHRHEIPPLPDLIRRAAIEAG
jgi:hypothetical protein